MMGVYVVLPCLLLMGYTTNVHCRLVSERTASTTRSEYIIVLKEDAPSVRLMADLCSGDTVCVSSARTKSRNVINGKQLLTVSADDHVIETLRRHPFVKAVGRNVEIVAFEMTYVTEVDDDVTEVNEIEPTTTVTCVSQSAADLWGLDRLDQRHAVSLPNDYVHGLMEDYGATVTAYVVDSGVDVNNSEFGGRATWGFTAVDVGSDVDENGHGTHVAGTIGAVTYGVAKEASIVAVKVLNRLGYGSAEGLIAGLEWLANDYQRKGKPHSVVNLSLGFRGISEPVDEAVQAVVDMGIPVVAAAGNSNADACLTSPAHVADVITVGAHDAMDTTASFSNWGSCLDIWAPGKYILSITPFGPRKLDGTSMSSPHVTGIVARYLATMTSTKPTVAEVAHWLDSLSTKDRLTFDEPHKASSPNKIAYMDCAQSWTTPVMTTTTSSTNNIPKVASSYYLVLIFCLVIWLVEERL